MKKGDKKIYFPEKDERENFHWRRQQKSSFFFNDNEIWDNWDHYMILCTCWVWNWINEKGLIKGELRDKLSKDFWT